MILGCLQQWRSPRRAFAAVALAVCVLAAALPELDADAGGEEERASSADVAELQALLAQASRPRVRAALSGTLSVWLAAAPGPPAGAGAGSCAGGACAGDDGDDPLPHLEEVEDWDTDVKLTPPPAAAAARSRPEDAPGGRRKQAARERAARKGGKETTAARFVGAPSEWVEVWSPKVKVTLLPYGVAECSHVRGQLEQCNLEGCHSGREYPRCHKEKPFPKHPIDSDSLLPLPPAPPVRG